MLSLCCFSTPDEVYAYTKRIRCTPDDSHMLCIFLPLPSFSLPLPSCVPGYAYNPCSSDIPYTALRIQLLTYYTAHLNALCASFPFPGQDITSKSAHDPSFRICISIYLNFDQRSNIGLVCDDEIVGYTKQDDSPKDQDAIIHGYRSCWRCSWLKVEEDGNDHEHASNDVYCNAQGRLDPERAPMQTEFPGWIFN